MIYVPPTGPLPARIMLVGEAPGGDEERELQPFVGYAGRELNGQLHEAGLSRSECFITNVVRFRPEGNKIENFIWDPSEHSKKDHPPVGFLPFEGMFVAPFVPEHISHLRKEISVVNPNVIVPLGNTALWALCGIKSVSKWRGSELSTIGMAREGGLAYKVIPTLHPAFVLRMYSQRAYAVEDLKRAKREAERPVYASPAYSFIVRPTFSTATDILRMLLTRLDRGPLRIVSDLETRRMRHIACAGIGWSKTEAMCIPFLCVEKPQGYWDSVEEELAITELLRAVLLHPNAILTGQNYNYDQQYTCNHWGFTSHLAQDTMLGWHTCFPGTEKRLDILASLLCEHYIFWKEENKEWGSEGEDTLWNYNCKDCVYTYEIAEEEVEMIETLGMQKQFDFQMRVNRAALNVMLRGCRRDPVATFALHTEVEGAMKERLDYLQYVLGHHFNPSSNGENGQMQKLFYEDFKLPPILSRSTRRPTLDGEALETLAQKEPLVKPLVQAITEYRSLGVYKSTFLEAKIHPDQRIRSNFNTGGAETFRWSSSKDAFGMGANLQNIPKGTSSRIAKFCRQHGPTAVRQLAEEFSDSPWEILDSGQKEAVLAQVTKEVDDAEESGMVSLSQEGKDTIVHYRLLMPNIRKLFIPDLGCVIMDWDLDRADLQVVVWESGDKELKQRLRSNVDIHAENAKELGVSRSGGKRFIHLSNYGGKASTAGRKIGVTTAKAEFLQKRWFGLHPGIKDWQNRVQAELVSTHSVSNKFGYRRFYFDRISECYTEALAWCPQSTVAIVINSGLLNLEDHQPSVQTLLQVHDSLVVQVPLSFYPSCVPTVRAELSIVVPYEDPLVIPVSGKASLVSWGDCEDIKDENLLRVNV